MNIFIQISEKNVQKNHRIVGSLNGKMYPPVKRSGLRRRGDAGVD